MSWNVNETIYNNRDMIPHYSREFLNNGQQIVASVMPYLNGTTFQCILSQSMKTYNTAIGFLFVGKIIKLYCSIMFLYRDFDAYIISLSMWT